MIEEAKRTEFLAELRRLINRLSLENEINMPDFLIAEMLCDCFEDIGRRVKERDKWFGIDPWREKNSL
jgi:hypothetical protein